MTKASEGLWYDGSELDALIKKLVSQKVPPSSKGHIPCPDCPGTLLWAKDYVGFYYIRCLDCQRKNKAN